MGCHKCATKYCPRLAVYTDETWAGWVAACKRAGWRRHYNSVRQSRADVRRSKAIKLWMKLVFSGVHGAGAKVARLYGVSRSTISRDVRYLHLLDEIIIIQNTCREAGQAWYPTIAVMRELWLRRCGRIG
ncbi:MAG: hypothetical protein NTY19_07680 [Planctomycetota bacterium]|nr:hypothetical protein [Planctomycetota bacterium]